MEMVCRLCMETCNLNHTMENNSVLQMVEECVQLSFLIDSPLLPAEICDDCYYKIKDFYEFKENCRNIQDLLYQELAKCGIGSPLLDEEDDHELYTVMDIPYADEAADRQDTHRERPSGTAPHSEQNGTVSTTQHKTGRRQRHTKVPRRTENGVGPNVPHVNEYERCTTCGKVFRSKTGLLFHRRVCADPPAHECTMCGKVFQNLDSMNRHKLHHSRQRRFRCSQCPLAFHKKSILQVHQRTHTKEKPYICEFCGNDYAYYRLLKGHIERHHTATPLDPVLDVG